MLVCKHLGKVKRRGTDGEYIFACPKVEARQTTLKDCAGCKLLDLSKQMVLGGSGFSETEYGDRLPILAGGGGGCGGKKKLVDKSASLPIIGQDADGREILDFGQQTSLKCVYRGEMVGSERITICPNKTRSMAVYECTKHDCRCSHQKYASGQPDKCCLSCDDGPWAV